MKCHHHNVCNKNASQNVRVMVELKHVMKWNFLTPPLIFRKESYCPGCVPNPLISISHMIYDIDNRSSYPLPLKKIAM